MMPRRSSDNINLDYSEYHQQQQQQHHLQSGTNTSPYQQQPFRSSTRHTMNPASAVAATYHNVPNAPGGFSPSDIGNDFRRYSISVAPGNTVQASQLDHQQQQQMGSSGMMHSGAGTHSHPSMGGFRPQDSSITTVTGMGTMGPTNYGMSDSVTQRMQHMGAAGMFMGGGGSSSAAGGGYGSATGNAPMDLSHHEQPQMGGQVGTQMPGQSIAASGGAGGSSSLSQAEREEELLLNLLIARRQRTQMSSSSTGGNTGGESNYPQPLVDELMRLRQSRAMSNQSTTPGSIQGLPQYQQPAGMSHHLGPGGPGGMFPPGNTPTNTSVMEQASAMHRHLPEMTGRIDRSPGRTFDARTQEMLDMSLRGKRGGYADFSAMKYGAPTLMDPLYGAHMASEASMPPIKKRRTHKKKPADMPRRPLSAYNLFFSEERERILKEIESKDGALDKQEENDSAAKSGDETGDEMSAKKEEADDQGDDSSKPKALLRPLIPSQKKRRPHRKTHGKISFQELARMVGERWKSLPEERRKYYQDLAKEDMKRQKVAMEEYYSKQNVSKGGKGTKTEDDKTEESSLAQPTTEDLKDEPEESQSPAPAAESTP